MIFDYRAEFILYFGGVLFSSLGQSHKVFLRCTTVMENHLVLPLTLNFILRLITGTCMHPYLSAVLKNPGSLIVLQNQISCRFSEHLSDFTGREYQGDYQHPSVSHNYYNNDNGTYMIMASCRDPRPVSDTQKRYYYTERHNLCRAGINASLSRGWLVIDALPAALKLHLEKRDRCCWWTKISTDEEMKPFQICYAWSDASLAVRSWQ